MPPPPPPSMVCVCVCVLEVLCFGVQGVLWRAGPGARVRG